MNTILDGVQFIFERILTNYDSHVKGREGVHQIKFIAKEFKL